MVMPLYNHRSTFVQSTRITTYPPRPDEQDSALRRIRASTRETEEHRSGALDHVGGWCAPLLAAQLVAPGDRSDARSVRGIASIDARSVAGAESQ
jgi:hypothetical protein